MATTLSRRVSSALYTSPIPLQGVRGFRKAPDVHLPRKRSAYSANKIVA